VDHVWGPHPSIGQNLSSELGELQERGGRVRDSRTIEGEQLSRLTMATSDALVDLNVLPIHGITMQPQSAKGVLTTFGLVLERLREVAPSCNADTYSGRCLYGLGLPRLLTFPFYICF
jgi:hypothetical protein